MLRFTRIALLALIGAFSALSQPVLPVLNSLNPSSVTTGGPGFTLTVNGSGFFQCVGIVPISCLGINWQPAGQSPTFIAAGTANAAGTQMTASISAALIATAGTVSISVQAIGGTSNSLTFTINSPPPVITSLSPSSVTAGGPGFTVTVNGSGFTSGAVVNWNGAALPTTFGSATQLTATVSSSLIASGGTATVTVTSGGVTSAGVSFPVNPGPTISSLSPGSATAGGAAFALTVNGSGFGGFTSGAVVNWNGAALPTTFGSATQLTATVSSSLIATPGTANVTVTSGGVTSAGVSFPINSGLAISSLSPSSATAGGAGFTLTVNGSGFASGAVVNWNGGALPTTFGSAAQLTATVNGSLIASAGAATVTVTSSGVTSAGVSFPINSGPTISSLGPGSATAGGAGFTLTVNGNGFAPGAVVNWNGTALNPTTFVNPIQLTAPVGAALIATPGTANVTVTSGGVTSAGLSFPINSGPTISSLSPGSATAGGAGFTLMVNGSGFAPGAVVNWNGAALPTTFGSATQLTAPVSSSLIASAGTATVTVTSGGVTSAGLSFPINSGPTISSLSPGSATAGGAGFTLTVNGSGFATGAVVNWNGAALPTTFGSATQLTAPVSSSLIASAGTATVTVTSGGVTSAGVSFPINPGLTISSLSPGSATAGGAGFTLTVNGSGFASGAVVNWNGGALPTTFGSATQLTATVSSSLIASAGTATVTVTSGGVTSAGVSFPINPPMIISLSPSAVDAAGPGFNLTVNGTGFVSVSVVEWNGSALTTSFGSASQLSASVPARLIANPGTAAIIVANASGIVSAAATFTIRVPPLPAITFSGPSTAEPATQPAIAFSISDPYPFAITGQMNLSFQPDVVNPGGVDPAVQFMGGGTSLSISISANSTTVPNIAIQTGTTAGTITISAQLQSAGQPITLPDVSIQILRAAPMIKSVNLTQTSSGLQVDVIGYATSREVTQATFHFVATGATLQPADFPLPVSSAFTAWYQRQDSQQYGTQFKYTEIFSATQGNATTINSVTVTLSNSVGASQSASN